MRYEPEHKTRTRDRIVRNAARKLRAEGLSGPGVASVMKASGLTVGGFYKHFRSKDELLAEAIAQGFADLARRSIRPCKTCRVRTGGRRSFGCISHPSTVIIPTPAARLRRWRLRLRAPNSVSENELPG